MTNAARIPATIITGFLGAGKTTLLRHLLETARGKRLAIIVNEFGSVGVDGEVLRSCGIESCPEENIVELSNGCLCCTVAEDFIPTMQALIDRDLPPEHILIETSGLALPKPLVKAFDWPSIRSRLTVDGVIAVVDAPAVAEGRFADDPEAVARQRAEDPSIEHDNPLAEVYEDQLMAADLIVLNKSDLISADAGERLKREVLAIVPRAVKHHRKRRRLVRLVGRRDVEKCLRGTHPGNRRHPFRRRQRRCRDHGGNCRGVKAAQRRVAPSHGKRHACGNVLGEAGREAGREGQGTL